MANLKELKNSSSNNVVKVENPAASKKKKKEKKEREDKDVRFSLPLGEIIVCKDEVTRKMFTA